MGFHLTEEYGSLRSSVEILYPSLSSCFACFSYSSFFGSAMIILGLPLLLPRIAMFWSTNPVVLPLPVVPTINACNALVEMISTAFPFFSAPMTISSSFSATLSQVVTVNSLSFLSFFVVSHSVSSRSFSFIATFCASMRYINRKPMSSIPFTTPTVSQ